jgi:hypothetical protein
MPVFQQKNIREFELIVDEIACCFCSEVIFLTDKSIKIKAEYPDLLNIPTNTVLTLKTDKDNVLYTVESKIVKINKDEKTIELSVLKASKLEREAYRIEDYFPVFYRLISEEEFGFIKNRSTGTIDISSAYELPSNKTFSIGVPQDQVIYDLLIELHRKVDILIKDSFSKKNKKKLNLLSCSNINLSSVGVGFYSSIEFKRDNILELVFELPTTIPTDITAVGKVIKSFKLMGKDAGLFKTGIEYLQINHRTLEILIQYIIAKQRELLRTIKDI